MINAVITGDLEQAISLIENKGADVNIQDTPTRSFLTLNSRQAYWTPLMYATARGDLSMVKLLVEEWSVDVNKEGPDGITPLMVAASSNPSTVSDIRVLAHDNIIIGETTLNQNMENIEVMQFLLESGADIGATDTFGHTVYFHALKSGHVNSLRFLREYDSNANPIFQLQTANNPNTVNLLDALPLTLTSFKGNLEIVKLLINEWNVDINTRNDNGWTAIMAARFEGHSEIVNFLESMRAEFTQEDYKTLVRAEINQHDAAAEQQRFNAVLGGEGGHTY